VADGSVVPNGVGTVQGITANFTSLFAAVSTSFGAAGQLPDLRGYFVRGWGINGDGTSSGGFGQRQADEFRSHSHSITTKYNVVNSSGSNNGNRWHSEQAASTGAAGGNETRPKNIALLYCIKF
jgi:hypothetical protein